MLLDVEFHHLKTFVTVATTENLTRAAKALFTTPPSVSAHIKQLETELGLTLFERTAKGMVLTDRGRRLEPHARAVLERLEALGHAAASLRGSVSGAICLGINAAPDYLRVIDTIQRLRNAYPDIRMEIVSLSTTEILRRIDTGALDMGFAFGAHQISGLHFDPLGKTAIEIVLPVRYRETHARASLREIATLPWVYPTSPCPFMEKVQNLLSRHNLSINERLFADDDVTKTAYLEQGAAAGILESSEALALSNRGLVFIWRAPIPLHVPLYLVYPAHRREDPALQAVAGAVRCVWQATPPL